MMRNNENIEEGPGKTKGMRPNQLKGKIPQDVLTVRIPGIKQRNLGGVSWGRIS